MIGWLLVGLILATLAWLRLADRKARRYRPSEFTPVTADSVETA